MVDRLDTAARSALMRSIKASNTSPELFVRQLLHRLGYRFRLHRKDLPGKPDIVLPKHKAVIFVNGCFWHSHSACKAGHVPKSRIEYWGPKLEKTKARDIRNNANLIGRGQHTPVSGQEATAARVLKMARKAQSLKDEGDIT